MRVTAVCKMRDSTQSDYIGLLQAVFCIRSFVLWWEEKEYEDSILSINLTNVDIPVLFIQKKVSVENMLYIGLNTSIFFVMVQDMTKRCCQKSSQKK
jgi:cyanate permease